MNNWIVCVSFKVGEILLLLLSIVTIPGISFSEQDIFIFNENNNIIDHDYHRISNHWFF